MSGRLSKADCPDVLAILGKNKCVEPRIQKPDSAYPYFPINFPIIDHEQSRFKIEVDRPSKRYSVLLPVEKVFRTVKEELHGSNCIYN